MKLFITTLLFIFSFQGFSDNRLSEYQLTTSCTTYLPKSCQEVTDVEMNIDYAIHTVDYLTTGDMIEQSASFPYPLGSRLQPELTFSAPATDSIVSYFCSTGEIYRQSLRDIIDKLAYYSFEDMAIYISDDLISYYKNVRYSDVVELIEETTHLLIMDTIVQEDITNIQVQCSPPIKRVEKHLSTDIPGTEEKYLQTGIIGAEIKNFGN